MGIASTVDISIKEAISRIREILSYIEYQEYDSINRKCYEPSIEINKESLDEALSKITHNNFFKRSPYENYSIVSEKESNY